MATWTRSWTRLTLIAAASLGLACGSDSGGNGIDASGWSPSGDGGPIEVRDGGVVIGDDGGTWVCYVTSCSGKVLECGDCVDNDGDGLYDSHDPECLGPCDNTEGPALTAGVGGETGGPCKADCYFDFGNGSGNDDCHWDHRCDPLSVAPDYPPEGADCAFDSDMVGGKECPADQSETCLQVCPPLTPNGCDCFGCCTFPELAGGYVWIGAMDEFNNGTCTFDDISDPSKCPPCTPVGDCINDCARCELCLGKDQIPDDCTVEERCPEGIQTCGLEGDAPCAAGDYCITGCCQAEFVVN